MAVLWYNWCVQLFNYYASVPYGVSQRAVTVQRALIEAFNTIQLHVYSHDNIYISPVGIFSLLLCVSVE